MINKVLIEGFTGKKLKKYVQGEKSYMYFDLACRRNYKNVNDQYDTDWVTFVAYDSFADLLDGVDSGTMLSIEAVVRSFDRQVGDGEIKKDQSLVVERVHFLSKPKNTKETLE